MAVLKVIVCFMSYSKLQWNLGTSGSKMLLLYKINNPLTTSLRLLPLNLNFCTIMLQEPAMRSGDVSIF